MSHAPRTPRAVEQRAANVVLAAEHHLPLLNLTADEVAYLIDAAQVFADEYGGDPALHSALDKLDKLTTSTEETPA